MTPPPPTTSSHAMHHSPAIAPSIPKLDLLILMSVTPGVGGQRFIASPLAKLARAGAAAHCAA